MNRITNLPRTTLLRATAYGIVTGVVTALAIGIPSVVIPNGYFTRMTPVRPQDYFFLAITALLASALGASYALPAACPLQENKLAAGGFLSFLAVGCPVCNKVVVLLIGTTGALTYFEPLQPLLALISIGLLAYGLRLRWRGVRLALAGPATSPAANAVEP